MANYVRKIIAMLLAISLGIGMGLQAFAAAKIGETEYGTLEDAFKAANEDTTTEGSVEIQLTESVDLGSNIAVNRDITLLGSQDEDGQYVITRADGYTGTLFTVNKDSTFVLDGGVVIDGNNDWEFDEEEYYQDMEEGKSVEESQTTYTHSEEDGTVASKPMINVADGEVVMKDATIQNNYSNTHGNGVFSVPKGSKVTLEEGAEIEHIRNSVFGTIAGIVEMNGGKIEDVFAHNTNGGVVYVSGGEFNMNGGEITEVRTFGPNKGGNGNGIVAQVYGESSKMTMTGGEIHDNAAFCPGNGWGSAIYLNRGGDFTMTGGVIKDTTSDGCTSLVANWGTTIELLGGLIEVEKSTDGGYASLFYGDVTVGEEMKIVGEEDALFVMLGDKGHSLKFDGEISGDGTMWLCPTETVTGKGTITSDVLIKADSWLDTPANVVLGEANWNCFILVDSVGSGASLTVKPGANVTDGMVRVLESVESGDYREAEASKTAQDSAFKLGEGAEVKSPVRYYHRLTADQNKGVVVTLDYNGGVDENGWSGCQITAEDVLSITKDNSLIPTIVSDEGLVFAGWNFAEVLDPESLDMSGDVAYGGEEIGTTLRLIAQWKVKEEEKQEEQEEEEIVTEEEVVVVIDDEPAPLDEAPTAPEEQYDVPSDAETETILDEEVPLADVPGLGDESAIWMLVAAFAIFGLVVINLPKRKCEDD